MRRSLLFVVLVVTACGGSVDLADYGNESLDAECDFLVKCGLFPDHAACQKVFGDLFLDNPSVQAAVDAGKLGYDGEAAQDCFDALRSASCSRDAQNSDACDHIFTGKIADGAACAFDEECVSGNCNLSDCTMACCPGTCAPSRPVPGLGQPCTFECVDGAYCAADSTCQPLVAKGGACDDSGACDRGLYCAGRTSTTPGTCTALPKTGEPCTTTCLDIGDRCSGGVCKPVGLLGDACMTDTDCSFFYACDATQHCAEQPADPRMPNGSMCTRSTDCTSHYCGNDNLCADVPLCI